MPLATGCLRLLERWLKLSAAGNGDFELQARSSFDQDFRFEASASTLLNLLKGEQINPEKIQCNIIINRQLRYNFMENKPLKVRLDKFDPTQNCSRGRSKLIEAAWYAVKCFFFLSPFPWPSSLKVQILRLFCAEVGSGVVIKPRVNIHFPWKLNIGDHSWIGEEVFILNFEPCIIGAHCCISQRAFLCGGNHDFRSIDFKYRNGPITIADGSWVGAQTFVAPSIKVGEECVITAGSVVTKSLPEKMVCSGNPCQPIKARWN